MQVVFKVSIRYIVIHQKELLLVSTIPKELNKIAVAKVPKDDNLSDELLHPLLWWQPLDSNHLLGMVNHSSKGIPKASFAEEHPVLESTCGSQ
jgi:hypothetical protein